MTTRNLFDRPDLLDNQTRLIISANGKPKRLIRSATRSAGQNLAHERSDSMNSAYFGQEIDDDLLDENLQIINNENSLARQWSNLSIETDYDTDIEEKEEPIIERTCKSTYIEQCRRHGIIPSTYILRHIDEKALILRYSGLRPINIKVIVPSLKINSTITKLDLRDNGLGSRGAIYIAHLIRENGYIAELNLGNNDIGTGGCKALCRALNLNFSIRILHLDGNRFNDDCAEFFADVFSQNEYIKYINLNKNLFENEATGRLFGQSFGINQTLEEVHLGWNHLNSKACGYIMKQLNINERLITLNLSWNGAGLFAAKAINDLLKTNKTLEKLHLNNNRFNTECATYIGKGLSKNETLKVLTLNGNPLESSGCYAILRPLIKHPTSQLQLVDLRGIIVNKDFVDLLIELSGILSELVVKAGSEGEREME